MMEDGKAENEMSAEGFAETVERMNPDAIYAALVWRRDYDESNEGKAASREVFDTKAGTVDFLRGLVKGHGTSIAMILKINASPELLEEIYPGEPVSVEVGLYLAGFIAHGEIGPKMAEMYLNGDDAIAQAVQHFIADRAH